MDDYGHQTTTTGKTFAIPSHYWVPLQKTMGKRKGCIRKSGLVREPSSESFLSDIQDQAKRRRPIE